MGRSVSMSPQIVRIVWIMEVILQFYTCIQTKFNKNHDDIDSGSLMGLYFNQLKPYSLISVVNVYTGVSLIRYYFGQGMFLFLNVGTILQLSTISIKLTTANGSCYKQLLPRLFYQPMFSSSHQSGNRKDEWILKNQLFQWKKNWYYKLDHNLLCIITFPHLVKYTPFPTMFFFFFSKRRLKHWMHFSRFLSICHSK